MMILDAILRQYEEYNGYWVPTTAPYLKDAILIHECVMCLYMYDTRCRCTEMCIFVLIDEDEVLSWMVFCYEGIDLMCTHYVTRALMILMVMSFLHNLPAV